MKKKVVVVYGGRSTEHEISKRSAAFVLANVDQSKYDVFAIGITEEGEWLPQDPNLLLTESKQRSPRFLSIHSDSPDKLQLDQKSLNEVRSALELASPDKKKNHPEVVFFPVIHGTNGEDGSLQGFFDLANAAYVGPGTLGSSLAIDKVVAKQRVEAAGIHIVPYKSIRKDQWKSNADQFVKECIKELGPHLFVKPATLGSSVGVSPANSFEECMKACDLAFHYDLKVLVEKSINAREIECAALGGYDPEISLPGEVATHNGFYSFDAKYMDPNASTITVPAKLSDSQIAEVRELSKRAFQALELYGMSRMDFFLCKDTGQFYFNEANTIPGFTEISQYPQLWKNSGLDGPDLISRLIELAWQRKQDLDQLNRSR